MMLRASNESAGDETDLRTIVDEAVESDLAHGDLLTALAEALVCRSDELQGVREQLYAAAGEAALIDAAGTAANFQRMVRIADGAGIPLDENVHRASAGLREELQLGHFASAANTPSTAEDHSQV